MAALSRGCKPRIERNQVNSQTDRQKILNSILTGENMKKYIQIFQVATWPLADQLNLSDQCTSVSDF